jgi:DNA-directed RNA polymerase specialized sigma24 family protein
MIGFDRPGRPVRVVDFDFDALDGAAELDQRLKDRLAVSEWFRVRFEWIMRGRTMRSRRIRRAIVQAEIDGTTISAIAKRFGVTRQAVHEQLKALRKLDAFFIGKND